ncbi:3-deoxy-D-manno-octulosonic acid transferase [Hufsiella ginkgonis]|uniref:3-deoxy-D-manno-octulosonic acid transferase n=1 Tax=Hufsiella ginkgonis TaxID=2695274 RepID=A0A7K1XUQ9_9SPHI|nr:glycosyltransferase N-terminal domain-containing protein [Hufsiella ginkgonis]MXV14745.1 3-deoxy-D-manno-octulosonic acid transferase [Hufsiella ginkgonis]
MLFFYNLGIALYTALLWVLQFFNPKAKKWVKGREGLLPAIAKALQDAPPRSTLWFHFSSLGEFEQGRPVLEQTRQVMPQKRLVVTFFSPSGYEIRKGYPLADHVFYLPTDTEAHAEALLSLLDPEFAVFTKYDYWYHYFNGLRRRGIPLYVISAIYNEKQSFFRWYGFFSRRMLALVTHIFVQDQQSLALLKTIGINQVAVSGDTRFDRVAHLAQAAKSFPAVQDFAGGSPVLIAGSTWPKDEELIKSVVSYLPGWKFIIAPHEIGESRILGIESLFAGYGTIKFQEPDNSNASVSINTRRPTPNVLIINNIGLLSSLYRYASLAYIGGGFGAGIHNTLEAATFNLPVIFGPNYQRFREARDLVSQKAGFSVATTEELAAVIETLKEPATRIAAGKKAGDYVRENTGATAVILKHILTP